MTAKKLIKIIFVIVIITIVAGYTYYQSHDMIVGPQLTIHSPTNGSSTTEAFVLISGTAKNISSISVDDRPILINTSGEFTNAVILHPGYNTITIKAEGKFGRTVEKTLELIALRDSVPKEEAEILLEEEPQESTEDGAEQIINEEEKENL